MQKLSTREILQQNLDRSVPGQLNKLNIWLHNVRSMHNVGAAFRSADAFGIQSLLFSGYTPTPPRPEISKTAIGAEKHVEWESIEETETKVKQLKEAGYLLVGLEQTTHSILLPDYEIPSDKSICLIFGNEVTGLDKDFLPHIDQFVEIPQYGHKHSLNVSVTVGVALYAFLEKYW
ncbi:TrmH family RNA methyltransferase [Fodinibius sediminis]|uniref:SpoU rRNA Methylase family protein n=1 Tax=Fodinibius sediminis TaxID=1214077 RepID=A0A521DCT7_9BACT|nr:TrmH family RNA methyltransferase [Fodinibius sediminis]SMO69483.1 SpoU rRNA Methylase family protein [Fodinibius sediminis]